LRIAVLADIHGNYDALKAVLNDVGSADAYIILGDLVDYGPEPEEVVSTIRELRCFAVRGNHDHAVAYNVDCGCGIKTHWVSVTTREIISKKYLSRESIEFLGSLPLRLELYLSNLRLLLVHAVPSSPLHRYLYPWHDAGLFHKALGIEGGSYPFDMVLLAHTHHQFIRVLGNVVVINPGSVGQPRDGDPRAAYAVIDTDSREIYLRRVRYDVESTLRKLRKVLGNYVKEYEFLSKLLSTGTID